MTQIAAAPQLSTREALPCMTEPWLFDDDEAKVAEEACSRCFHCPVLDECRAWSLMTVVPGVAGGLTAKERSAWRRQHHVTAASYVEPVEKTDARLRDAAAVQLTRSGLDTHEIAIRFGCTPRTIERAKHAAGVTFAYLPDIDARPPRRRHRGKTAA